MFFIIMENEWKVTQNSKSLEVVFIPESCLYKVNSYFIFRFQVTVETSYCFGSALACPVICTATAAMGGQTRDEWRDARAGGPEPWTGSWQGSRLDRRQARLDTGGSGRDETARQWSGTQAGLHTGGSSRDAGVKPQQSGTQRGSTERLGEAMG